MCEEHVEQNATVNSILERYHAEFEGKGADDKYNEKLQATFEALSKGEDPDVDFKLAGSKGDPYARLGYGFEAYFRMIKCYTILFIIFSLMCIPIYYLYWS